MGSQKLFKSRSKVGLYKRCDILVLDGEIVKQASSLNEKFNSESVVKKMVTDLSKVFAVRLLKDFVYLSSYIQCYHFAFNPVFNKCISIKWEKKKLAQVPYVKAPRQWAKPTKNSAPKW